MAAALVDAPAVQAEVQRRLSQALGGQITWESLEVGLFPPRADLLKARLEVPAKVSASADELKVYLRLWPLLLGRPEVSSILVRKPSVRLLSRSEGGGEPLDPVRLYRAAMEPTATALREYAPDMAFRLEGAALDLAPLELRGLDASLKTDGEGFDLELSSASNFWQRLAFKGRVVYADVSASGELTLDLLTADKTLPPAPLRASLRTDAKTSIEAQLSDIDLAQALAQARARIAGLDAIESAGGKLALRATASAGAPWRVDFQILKSNAVIKLAQLPAPVALESGAAQIDAKQLRLDKIAVALLDARTQVSGSIGFARPNVELALAEGIAGDQLMTWVLERGAVPPRLTPKTPLRFSARRIAWTPRGAVEADARLLFDAGPEVTLALAWRPELLDLKQVTIRDARSNASLSAAIAAERTRVRFAGTLEGRSLVAMLKTPVPASGTARGNVNLTIDRKRPDRTLGTGELRIEALDLSWLAGKKAVIELLDLASDGTGAQIRGARVSWEDQAASLTGSMRRTERGPVIDARIESPGIALDRLLPPPDPNAPKKKSVIWPLPVSGRIEMRSAFVAHKTYRIEPFAGVLTLAPERARLEVKEARMCGLAFPMEVEAVPEELSAAAHITMSGEPLERSVPCLTGGAVQLTGNASLKAELNIRGRRPHLLRSLTGTVQAEAKQGSVQKFALIGNILSFRNIASADKMRQQGFPYRSMTAKGHFASGAFQVEEAFFDSDAVRLAAHGSIDMLGADSQLTVLVGLLTHVDRITGAIPIVGDIFGGSMLALPVQVAGDIRDPRIVPLGPRAVTNQLLGIFERTLKLPGKLAVPPAAKPEAKP